MKYKLTQEVHEYIGHHVDDAGSDEIKPVNTNTRLVVYQCGFEPMVVAVHSYLPNVRIDDAEAEELAQNLLLEKKWFRNPRKADKVI